MTWGRIDDAFWRHPKITGLSPAAGWLYIRAISYSCDQLTDGRLRPTALRMLGASPAQLRELTNAGLFEVAGNDRIIHDFLDYNRSRVDVLDERAAAQARMAKTRGGSPKVRANKQRTEPEVQTTFPLPDPDPDPGPEIPATDVPPDPPQAGGTRARRAAAGSKRRRDVAALEATGASRYFAGKYGRVLADRQEEQQQKGKAS